MLTFWLIFVVTVATQNIANAEDVYGKLKLVFEFILSLILEEYVYHIPYTLYTYSNVFSTRSELETFHSPGAELGNAIKIVNQVCICKWILIYAEILMKSIHSHPIKTTGN